MWCADSRGFATRGLLHESRTIGLCVVAGGRGECRAGPGQRLCLRREDQPGNGAPTEDSRLLRRPQQRPRSAAQKHRNLRPPDRLQAPRCQGPRRGPAPRRCQARRARPAAWQERARRDRRSAVDVPGGVGRRGRLSQRADGHQPHRRRLYQERRAAQHRQPAERRVPGRPRRAQQRALPHPVVHPRHPPAQPDGRRSAPTCWSGRAGSPPARAASIRARSASIRTTTRPNSSAASRWSSSSTWARSRSGRTRRARSTCSARSSRGRCCR